MIFRNAEASDCEALAHLHALSSIRMNGGDNHSARGSYERFGGISVERSFHHAPDGNDVAAVRYVWDGLTRLAKQLSIGH
jgi:hypothetical protein